FFRIGWRSVANDPASRVILRPPMFALQPEMKIFSGSANRELAQRICNYIGVTLGQATISAFPDGETYVKIEENIRGRDVFIIQPTCPQTNFFFSSRRRHTSLQGDWSSDVCSSD